MKQKVKWGDRRDGKRVDAPGLQTVMTALFPKRTECEVYLHDTIDATKLMEYLEKKNEGRTEGKVTIFHCVITALDRMVRERPLMNRFIQGYRIYERNEISLSFVAKRRFADGAEETLMYLVPKDTDTINEISAKIIGDVHEARKSDHATGGVDELLDKFAALPRPLLAGSVRMIRYLDFWGVNPKFITDGDPNYSTILVSNLGSIKCPSVYHHLNNYGTNSIMVTVGTLHKEEVLMEDGHKEIRDVIDIGATLDERIADGFYFARSLKLLRHIFENPELLERPLNEPSNFDYK
ncbi:MAG: 2-oxo acid dehydrogenase subunit E2 [Erysipelotrichaceae bacterium]|nr:2-oxo acid dehydrogenase subunit E2 [Erysipelotrichaceae bacterium]